MIVRYLDPKTDIVFKKIFGSEKNKDVLIHFLNDIVRSGDRAKIKEIKFLNTQDPEIKYQKQSIIDVLCTDENGVIFIVEMQVAKVGGFEKRAQYYEAKAYCSQAKEGEEYADLKEVIFLVITDYIMFPNKAHYKSEHVILDRKSHKHDLRDFSFTFIELPKFKKEKVEELTSYEEKWCYFFKHSNNQEDMKQLVEQSDEVINKAYDVLKSHNWNEEKLRQYEKVMKINMDAKARESYVKQEGRAEGMKEGWEKGMQKGKEEEKKEIARKMLRLSMPMETVIEISGLSLEEIIAIKDNTE